MDEFLENTRIIEDRKRRKKLGKENQAKNAIKRKAKISVETATIGALADFERVFGYLWGKGKNFNTLSLEEKEARKQWLSARLSILDRCENSKRILMNSIDRCVIEEYDTRYVTVLKGDNNGR